MCFLLSLLSFFRSLLFCLLYIFFPVPPASVRRTPPPSSFAIFFSVYCSAYTFVPLLCTSPLPPPPCPHTPDPTHTYTPPSSFFLFPFLYPPPHTQHKTTVCSLSLSLPPPPCADCRGLVSNGRLLFCFCFCLSLLKLLLPPSPTFPSPSLLPLPSHSLLMQQNIEED